MPDHLARVHPFLLVSLLRIGHDDDIDAFINEEEMCDDEDVADFNSDDVVLEDDHKGFIVADGEPRVRHVSPLSGGI